MAFSLGYRRLAEAVVATAAMFYFGNGLETWWPLMWFALRSKWWTAAVTAVAVMMLGNLNIWSYFKKTLGMPGAAWVNIFLAAGVVFAAAVLLFRVLVLQRRGAERGSCFAG